MLTARPCNVGPCAARDRSQKIDPAIELLLGGEVCPGFPRPHSYGHRCTRALAVRPLQPSRAWSRRLDRRHRRRPVALLRSRTVLPTIPERRRLYTLVYHICLCSLEQQRVLWNTDSGCLGPLSRGSSLERRERPTVKYVLSLSREPDH